MQQKDGPIKTWHESHNSGCIKNRPIFTQICLSNKFLTKVNFRFNQVNKGFAKSDVIAWKLIMSL